MEDKKTIITVWDADFIPYYVCHNKKNEDEKTLDECINLANSLIDNINNHNNADLYCGFITKGKCFRYDINPSYKSNRKYLNLPKYINEVKEHIECVHNFTFKEGYEADDLVLSFERHYSQFKPVLVSPDKDILTAGKNVYNPRLNTFKSNSDEEIKEAFWRSMITGDTIDGIKGIPGKGNVFSTKLFININNEESLRTLVFDEYINHFGEYEGIKEFTKNYLSLKIVDNIDVSEIVKLNKVIKSVKTDEISKFGD